MRDDDWIKTTGRDRLLLRAASDPGPQGDAAWTDWLATGDLDAITRPEMDLLPSVFCHRNRPGARVPGRVRGIYRRTWYMNQRVITAAGQGIAALRSVGIEALVFKGVALLDSYGAVGARVMGDADILVRAREFSLAATVLVQAGFKPDRTPPRLRAGEKGLAFRDSAGLSLDLHAFALAEGLDEGCDDGFWVRSRSVSLLPGASTLDPADHLLVILTHGLWFNPSPSLRWIVDALHLCRRHPVDWGILFEEAGARRLSRACADALDFLSPLGLMIPEDVMQGLRSRDDSVERREQRVRISAPSGILGVLPLLRILHRRERSRDRRPSRSFAAFLMDAWDCDSLFEFGRTLLRKARSRLADTLAQNRVPS